MRVRSLGNTSKLRASQDCELKHGKTRSHSSRAFRTAYRCRVQSGQCSDFERHLEGSGVASGKCFKAHAQRAHLRLGEVLDEGGGIEGPPVEEEVGAHEDPFAIAHT